MTGARNRMCTEIEAKLKVDSHEDLEDRLAELGARFMAQKVQTDYYLDDSGSTLRNSDKCLRIRSETANDRGKVFVTYKGAKEQSDYKQRREIEFQITSLKPAEILFGELGYVRALVVQKRRRLWRLRNCLVALDELPMLGAFVEIEGPDSSSINRIQNDMGLSGSMHIQQSYADLAQAELTAAGDQSREVLF